MRTSTCKCTAVLATCLTFCAVMLRADQLQMQNGDHYNGKILSVTPSSVVLQSDVLGKITLPRNKVSVLTMGEAAATNAVPAIASAPALPAPSPAIAGTNADLAAAFRNLGGNTNFIQQVREQMLAGTSPEANQKYDELVGGLLSGKLNMNDLRNEAKSSIAQINQMKHELGPEADDALDSYLSILESFVNETASEAPAAPPHSFSTNSMNSAVIHSPDPQPKPGIASP